MLKKEKRNSLLIVLLIIAILVFIVNIYLFSKTSKILEVKQIDSSIIVSNKIGFDLNSTSLTFGSVFPGGSSLRTVNFDNKYGFPVIVEIYGEGDMERFILEKKEKIISGENRKIEITATAPENIDFGEYIGKVVFIVKKSN